MTDRVSRLSRWWQNSWLYALLAGSFFLGWLVGATDREIDYAHTSRVVALTERILNPILRWMHRWGETLSRWLAGSFLVRRWLALAGVAVLLAAIIVLRLTLSWGLASSLGLIGLGLLLTPNWQALADGTYLGRLTTWWLDD